MKIIFPSSHVCTFINTGAYINLSILVTSPSLAPFTKPPYFIGPRHFTRPPEPTAAFHADFAYIAAMEATRMRTYDVSVWNWRTEAATAKQAKPSPPSGLAPEPTTEPNEEHNVESLQLCYFFKLLPELRLLGYEFAYSNAVQCSLDFDMKKTVKEPVHRAELEGMRQPTALLKTSPVVPFMKKPLCCSWSRRTSPSISRTSWMTGMGPRQILHSPSASYRPRLSWSSARRSRTGPRG